MSHNSGPRRLSRVKGSPLHADVAILGARMSEKMQLLEIALEQFPDGVALLDDEGDIVYWNRACESLTGKSLEEMQGRTVLGSLKLRIKNSAGGGDVAPGDEPEIDETRGALIKLQHKDGHEVPAIVRLLALRDGTGRRVGTTVLLHPAASLDAMPCGECGEDSKIQTNQAEMRERLIAAMADFEQSGEPMGVLWISVDQAAEMRKSHGSRASEEMIDKMERTLLSGLRPGEQLGRWGDDEFLLLSHERSGPVLTNHGQMLVGLARTTDFRWWGDRPTLTISVGSAFVAEGVTLEQLLKAAQSAMRTSHETGGNKVTASVTLTGGQKCSQS